MKGILTVLALVLMASCNDTVNVNSRKVEEIREEADTLAGKIEQKVEEGWDSTKAKAKELKEKISDRLDTVTITRKDTTN